MACIARFRHLVLKIEARHFGIGTVPNERLKHKHAALRHLDNLSDSAQQQ